MVNYFESGIGKATLHYPSEDHVVIGRRAALEALSQIKQFQPCLAMEQGLPRGGFPSD